MENTPEPGSRAELFSLLRELPVVAVKAFGREMLRLVGLKREPERWPGPMTDEEVRRWNNENGFPTDWRL